VTYTLIRRGLDWMIGFIAPYTCTFTQLRNTGNYSAIAILHALQFTVAHALGFSVFTSRILATDLSQSHCHFISHMKSSCHSSIPSLPLFCSCQLRRLDSPLSSILPNTSYNHFQRTTQKTQPVLLTRRVYRAVA
jgi:hypothetical protein